MTRHLTPIQATHGWAGLILIAAAAAYAIALWRTRKPRSRKRKPDGGKEEDEQQPLDDLLTSLNCDYCAAGAGGSTTGCQCTRDCGRHGCYGDTNTMLTGPAFTAALTRMLNEDGRHE